MTDNSSLSLHDRMVGYERVPVHIFDSELPVAARIDGRSFSKFTSDMEKPFDQNFSVSMLTTAKRLVQETGANIGYTQSDEITLVWANRNPDSEMWFGGKNYKMLSQLGALATIYFYQELVSRYPSKYYNTTPTFDARVWQLPSLEEAANVFLWRQRDAVRNSIGMASHHAFGHKANLNKTVKDKKEMLENAGKSWEQIPIMYREGSFIQKVVSYRKFRPDELENLPPKHAAHTDPDLEVERTDYKVVSIPNLNTITNKAEVLFFGEEPKPLFGCDGALGLER